MVEGLSVLSRVFGDGLAVSGEYPFGGHKALETDRSAGMEFRGGNADLCSQTESEAVGEPRGAVDEHVCAVHVGDEQVRILLALSEDCIGVVRAVVFEYYFQECESDARAYAEESVDDYFGRIEQYLEKED